MNIVVRGVDEDARGIIAPDAGLTRFRLGRHAPSRPLDRFVDRYWHATWDLTGQEPYTQRVFSHPTVNIVFTPDGAAVHGVATQVTSRRLSGAGWALGVMFRPAGFRPLLDRPMTTVRDRVLGMTELFGRAGEELATAVAAAPTTDAALAVIERFLDARLPASHQPSEDTSALVERIAAEPAVARVETLSTWEGIGARQLQRRFADHVGLSPKAVIRRYRFYEAAERVRRGAHVDWAALATELGYSDQPHLTRDFTTVIGAPPERYARTTHPGSVGATSTSLDS